MCLRYLLFISEREAITQCIFRPHRFTIIPCVGFEPERARSAAEFKYANTPTEDGTMRFVIIGGDAAGMSAASRAKRQDPSMEVTVLEQSQTVSYSA
jgi:hypothetical protein